MGEFLTIPNRKKNSTDGENTFLKYGVCGMQGWRKRMEDAHICDISKGTDQKLNIFGVFDGHGGKEIAQFVSNHFSEELVNIFAKTGDLKVALKEAFLRMDELMKTNEGIEEIKVYARKSKQEDAETNIRDPPNSNMQMIQSLIGEKNPESDLISRRTGCTACVCVIDEVAKKIYFANAGDSRAVMSRGKKVEAMSIDHKPELQSEKERIYKADGWITEGRVKGNLNLTRGLGDLDYKLNPKFKPEEQVITADPDIRIEEYGEDIDCIIVGCDGIWDCMSNEEVVDYVMNRVNQNPSGKLSGILEEMEDSICATDLYNESGVGCDNMTCLVVQFKK